MHNAGIPLRHIQEISGHNDLGTLQRYLEVSPEQKKQAVSVIEVSILTFCERVYIFRRVATF